MGGRPSPSLEDLQVAVARQLGRPFPAELRQASEAEVSQLLPTALVSDDPRKNVEELVRVFRIEVFGGFVCDLRKATGSRNHRGVSRSEGLQDGQAETLVLARKDEGFGRSVEARELYIAYGHCATSSFRSAFSKRTQIVFRERPPADTQHRELLMLL